MHGGGALLSTVNSNQVSAISAPNEDIYDSLLNESYLNLTNINQDLSYTSDDLSDISDDLIHEQPYLKNQDSKEFKNIKEQEQEIQDLIKKTENKTEIADLNLQLSNIQKIQKNITQQQYSLTQLIKIYKESGKNLVKGLKTPPVYSYIQTAHTYYGNETSPYGKFTGDDTDFLRMYREDHISYKAPLYMTFDESKTLFTENKPNKPKNSMKLLKTKSSLEELNYSRTYKGYRMLFHDWSADFMVRVNQHPTHLQELKYKLKSVIHASDTIRRQSKIMNKYIIDNNVSVDESSDD